MCTNDSSSGRKRKISLPMCLPSNKQSWRDVSSLGTRQNTTAESLSSRHSGATRKEEQAMAAFRPKYLTFDCYGTLIDFQMSPMTRTMFADRLAPERLQAFTTDFSAYRFDEVLGEWKSYADVI